VYNFFVLASIVKMAEAKCCPHGLRGSTKKRRAGPADLAAIRAIKEAVSIPVVILPTLLTLLNAEILLNLPLIWI
jgi:hypothetical protein